MSTFSCQKKHTGRLVRAKEPTHILIEQLNNNLLPNLLFSQNQSFMLFLFKTWFSLTVLHAADLHRRLSFSQISVSLKRRQPVVLLCLTVFCQFIPLIKHLHRSYRLVRVSFGRDFTPARQYLLKIKKHTHFKAHPVSNIADQIKQLMFTREVSQ